jgi:prophage antirepressor-like protein
VSDHAEGGYVGSPGDDSIPFVIHPGEVWFTADQVRRTLNIELLEKLDEEDDDKQ